MWLTCPSNVPFSSKMQNDLNHYTLLRDVASFARRCYPKDHQCCILFMVLTHCCDLLSTLSCMVIWYPILLKLVFQVLHDLIMDSRAVTFGNWLGVLKGENTLKVPSKSFWIRISHQIWSTSFTTLWVLNWTLGVLRHSQRDIKLHLWWTVCHVWHQLPVINRDSQLFPVYGVDNCLMLIFNSLRTHQIFT